MSEKKREGYQFVGWYIDKECTKRLNPGGILPHSVTLYDKWIPIYYPIEYEVHGGVMSRRNPKFVCIESEEQMLYPAFKKGEMFAGWKYKGEIITKLSAGIHEPVILEAVYKPCPVVSFDTRGGGRFEACPTNEYGLLENMKVPVRPGCTFDGWFWDPEYRWRYNLDEPIYEDCTLYAHWLPTEYKIHYEVEGGYSSRRNPKSYTYFDDTIHLLPAKYAHSMGDKNLVAHFKKKEGLRNE